MVKWDVGGNVQFEKCGVVRVTPVVVEVEVEA